LRFLSIRHGSDGGLAKVTSRKNANSVYAPYVGNFSYTASGGISQMKFGNRRWGAAKFNTRMQVTELGLGTNLADANLWKTNYEYGELDSNGSTDAGKHGVRHAIMRFSARSLPV